MSESHRFSKATLLQHCQLHIDRLTREFRFDRNNGWKQVEGRGEAVNRAYGKYEALSDVIDIFNLVKRI